MRDFCVRHTSVCNITLIFVLYQKVCVCVCETTDQQLNTDVNYIHLIYFKQYPTEKTLKSTNKKKPLTRKGDKLNSFTFRFSYVTCGMSTSVC